ncbi:hydrogenase expression/formation protein HypE, partial [Candidatus Bipolaricaulota bacterium]|nr:hydrogenase expression/formation protein HypE [Candidatus Bipolaricaulota bacterium]
MTSSDDRISPLHGAGGELMAKLLAEHVLPHFDKSSAGRIGLWALDDGATIQLPSSGELVMTTDSHVVKPIFFPGGDIGKLAAAGTLNDLAVMGAKPLALSLA